MDSFNLDILKTDFGRQLAHTIVEHDFGPGKLDEEHRLLSMVIEHPSLLEFQQPLRIGDKKVGDLFLGVMGRAPVELARQFASIEWQNWRFGKLNSTFLCHSGLLAKNTDRMIPYRASATSIEEAYKKLADDDELIVLKADDDVVLRIIEVTSRPTEEESISEIVHRSRRAYGLADMGNGYVVLQRPEKSLRASPSDLLHLKSKVRGVFAEFLMPVLSQFMIDHDSEAHTVSAVIFGPEPAFDLFEPFATLVEDEYTTMHVSSNRRAADVPLLFKFTERSVKTWPGIPEGIKEFWRTETKVPKDYDKDSTFSQMLLHGVRLQSASAGFTDAFVQGASNVYRIDPNGPLYIWDHIPKPELRPGMPIGFLAAGPGAMNMVSTMWTHVNGIRPTGIAMPVAFP